MGPNIENNNDLSTNRFTKNKYFFTLFLLLVGISLIRIYNLSANVIDLSGDEAHYWEWSRRLDLCYYSKPPGVAYLIWLGTAIFGDTVLGVRIFAVILSFLSSLMLYKLGTRMYNKAVGFTCGVLLQIVPLFTAYGTGITPDTPLIFFWILSLWFFYEAQASGSPRSWLLLAVSLGLGLLSKYAIAFFYIPAFMLLVLYEENRKHLRKPWPYVAFLLSLLFFLPVIIWNMRHNWVTFRHDFGHSHINEGLVFSFGSLTNFIGSQLGVITPVLLVLILYVVIKQRKESPFCFWFCIPILAVFLLKSLQGKVQGNWALVAYVTGLIAFSAFMVRDYATFGVGMKSLIVTGLLMALAGTIFLNCPLLVNEIPFPPGKDPLRKMRGWRELGREVTVFTSQIEKPLFIFSDYYMTTSELAFYVAGHPRTYCINIGRRMNQYDIWPGFNDFVGYNAIYVAKGEMSPKLVMAFEYSEKRPVVLYDERGRRLTEFEIFLCYNFQGMDVEKPTSF